MYPWNRVSPETDSTLRLIHESVSRGHMVAIATTSQLTMRNSIVSAYCDVFVREKKVTSSIVGFYRHARFKRAALPLSGFDAIIMRDNPPLDNIAMNFLDLVRDDTFITNDIDGLRIGNNKLYTASFYAHGNEFIPTTHVSKNRDYLERVFLDSNQKKMILKPLVGYGGKGVIVIEKSAKASFRSLLDFYIDSDHKGRGNYVILQEYVEGAEQGDVRILMLNGQPIGAMRRVPAKGDVRSNVHAGGSVVKHTLTKREKSLCQAIGPKLVSDGLYFTGIDVIGGKLIEVNVLSPGGITRINKLNRVRLQAQVIDFIENIINTKEMVERRKIQFRQVIDDADNF